MHAYGKRQAHPRFDQPYSDKLEMVRASSTLVPVPRVPDGYRLRTLEFGEESLYETLFQLAFDDKGRIAEIQGKMLPGAFFVIEHLSSRRLVASCLAYHGRSSARHPNAGQLAWLVVDPGHGKKGLGTIVSATVTNRLVNDGYTRPFLRTEDFRIPAISIYLHLGWQPLLYTPEMKGRWERIFAALNGKSARIPNVTTLNNS